MKNNDYEISKELINGGCPDGFYEGKKDDTDNAILQIQKTHGTLSAVKYYKDISSENMFESKKYVDSLLEKNGIKKQSSKSKVAGKGCLLLIVIGVILSLFVYTCSQCSDNKTTEAKSVIDTLQLASSSIVIAEEAIKNQLKAPASAKFELENQIPSIMGDSLIRVMGSVDAQNSFGALIRSKYVVMIKFNKGYMNTDDYTVISANLAE